MKRKEAISSIILVLSGKEAIVSSTGLISRDLYRMNDSPQNFYMTGSMGLASSLGLGVAVCKPQQRVIVIEGDASLLMNLGSLTTIGHFGPKNLIHIVLDNRAYGSCSEEPSFSKTAKLSKIAMTVGYKFVKKAKKKSGLQKVVKESLRQKGPVFILAEIELGGRRDLPRPLNLPKVKERFKKFLSADRPSSKNIYLRKVS